MSQQVTIIGPNLPRPLSDNGTFHVHAAECADIKRRYPADIQRWTDLFENIEEVVTDIYPPYDFNYELEDNEYNHYRNDVCIFPCVTL